DVFNIILLFDQHREDIGKLSGQYSNQFMEERLFQIQPVPAVADGPAQNTANDEAASLIAGRNAIGNRKADGPNMIGDYTHGNIGIFILTISDSCEFPNFVEQRFKKIGIIVR